MKPINDDTLTVVDIKAIYALYLTIGVTAKRLGVTVLTVFNIV